MLKYIGKRLLQLIPVLIGITFLSFAMMRLAGGDAVTYMYENAGSVVSQEVIDQTKKEYGLDQPFLVQYGRWFAGMVTGDMGTSYVSGQKVYDTFMEKLPATILLTVSSMIVTMLTAIPLGIFSAIRHNRWSDYLIRFLSFIGNSAPNFFAALILMYVFCDGSQGQRCQRKCDYLEKCSEGVHADYCDADGIVCGKPSGRNYHCGIYFYVGRCR